MQNCFVLSIIFYGFLTSTASGVPYELPIHQFPYIVEQRYRKSGGGKSFVEILTFFAAILL